MITFKQKGDFNKTIAWLKRIKDPNFRPLLEKYAIEGLTALIAATPKDTGLTAYSWDYKIDITRSGFTINWTNSHEVNGIPVVILLQYGHATRSGSFVQGQDFINPAIAPIFDALSENIWKEVTKVHG